jgi:hypothetical protein
MREKRIDAIAELFAEGDLFDSSELLCYRGQANSDWTLVPTVFRDVALTASSLDTHAREELFRIERDINREFLDHAVRFMHGKSSWEALCYGQHYGVPTRLLDWTSNLLVAVYFTCIEAPANDGAVWCLRASRLPTPPELGRCQEGRGFRLRVLPTDEVSFLQEQSRPRITDKAICSDENEFLVVIQPPDIDERIRNQSSLFTVYITIGEDDLNLNGVNQLTHLLELEVRHQIQLVRKLIIPAASKPSLLKAVEKMGITSRQLFPDLVGLGQYLTYRQRDLLRRRVLT